MTKFLRKIFLVDLFQGLWVTFRNQNPKYIYTEQYPGRAAQGGRAVSRRAAAEHQSRITAKRCASPATCARWPARRT